jgi:hypothetical protein
MALVHVHPQACEVKSAGVSCDVTLNPHRRCIADPVMLRTEWSADVRRLSADLLLAPVHLIVMRGVSEHGVVGKQAHHQIEVLAWENAGGVEYDIDIADREDARWRAAVAPRRGEDGQAQQQSKNDKGSAVHVDSPEIIREPFFLYSQILVTLSWVLTRDPTADTAREVMARERGVTSSRSVASMQSLPTEIVAIEQLFPQQPGPQVLAGARQVAHLSCTSSHGWDGPSSSKCVSLGPVPLMKTVAG